MGQHKYNPTAIAAAKGELPPKEKKLGKRESERLLRQEMLKYMVEKHPEVVIPALVLASENNKY